MFSKSIKLPRWRANNSALAEALNILAQSIEDALNKEIVPGRNLFWSDDGRTTTFEADIISEDDPTDEINAYDITIDSNTLKATFVPGNVNGITPTNILESIDVPSGSNSFVYVETTTDGNSIQSSEIKIETEQPDFVEPAMNALPEKIYTELHIIKYVAGENGSPDAYIPVRTFYPPYSIKLVSAVSFTTPTNNPQPGLPESDYWYTWIISAAYQ